MMQDMQFPSRVTLQRSRLELDLATMVYSRRFILNASSQWFCHIRADSSPQGGRDFFVAEFDRLHVQHAPNPDSSEVGCLANLLKGGSLSLTTRILPLSIIGCRAASVSWNTKSDAGLVLPRQSTKGGNCYEYWRWIRKIFRSPLAVL